MATTDPLRKRFGYIDQILAQREPKNAVYTTAPGVGEGVQKIHLYPDGLSPSPCGTTSTFE